MSRIVFYEKPGCSGNARQRHLLEAAGHTLERRNLLTAHWTADTLLAFLAPLPVAQWFNRAAPRVKSGEVVPETLTAEQALPLLLAEPLLIRRPLLQHENGQRLVGFEPEQVATFAGVAPATLPSHKLEGCAAAEHAHRGRQQACPAPASVPS